MTDLTPGKMFDLLEGLLASSPDLVFVKDLERRFLFANLRMLRVLGSMSSADVVGKREEELLPGKDQARTGQEERQVFLEGVAVRREVYLSTRSGASGWFSLVKTPFRDTTGRIVGLVAIGRDIGLLKQSLADAEAQRHENEVYRRLINALPDIVFAKDRDSRFLVANNATAMLMKAPSADALIGRTDHDFYSRDIADRYRADEIAFMDQRASQIIEQPAERPDGSRGFLCSLKVPMLDAAGNVEGYIGHGRDVTDTRLAEHALREREGDLAEAQLLGNTGSCSWRVGAVQLSCSAGLMALFGLPAEVAIVSGRALLRQVLRGDRKSIMQALRQAKFTPARQSVRFSILRQDGKRRAIDARVRVGAGFQGERFYFGVCQDISDREAAEEALERLAFTDPLTGLANRAALSSALKQRLERGDRPGIHLSLLLVDLDGFKQINDKLGHVAGDDVLVEVSRRLQSCIRDGDVLARLGGDEFAIVMEHDHGPDMPATIARRCVNAMREPFLIDGVAANLGASVGIVTSSTRGETISQLLSQADRALYRAKREGRDGYRFFGQEADQDAAGADDKIRLASELRGAIERGEIKPYYQVQMSADGARIVGLEALARWEHPRRGLIPPADFIAMAERSSLIGDLGKSILDQACAQMREWLDMGWNPGTMSVNVSVAQLWHMNLPREVTRVLVRHRLAPQHLILEFTESVFIEQDQARVSDALTTLAAMGVGLAIDDFGSGSSGLSYLTHLPFGRLKIDRSYVTGASGDDKRAALLNGIVSMSRAVGMLTTAEGVETAADAELVRGLGCEFVQGYYFGKPMPASVFPPKAAGRARGT